MSSSKDSFFSETNYNMLLNIIKTDIKNRFNIAVPTSQHIDKILFNNMESAFKQNPNQKLPNLNKLVIRSTAPILLERAKSKMKKKTVRFSQNNSTKIINNGLRDMDINSRRQNMVSSRPQSVKDIENTSDVDRQFEKIQYDRRMNIQPTEIPKFELPQDDNQEDTNMLFNRLSKEREQQENIQQKNIPQNIINPISDKNEIVSETIFPEKNTQNYENQNQSFNDFINSQQDFEKQQVNIQEEINQKETEKINLFLKNTRPENTITSINNIDNFQNYDNNLSQMDQRIVTDNEIRINNDNSGVQPSSIYETNKEIHEEIITEFSQQKKDSHFTILPEIDVKKYMNSYQLEINSIDRKFNSNSNYNNFNFQVLFNQADDLTNSATIQNKLKNIYELKLQSVILPIEYSVSSNLDNRQNICVSALNYPFLLVQIEEFDGPYESTNNIINKSFCKIIYDDRWENSLTDFSGYLRMRPIDTEKSKLFYPTPLASLNRLTIKIVTPTGESFSNTKDFSFIKSISYDNTNNYIKLLLTKYMKSTNLKKNDIISIKNINLINQLFTPEVQQIKNKFCNFINKKEGHCIIDTSSSNSNTFNLINEVYIKNDSYIDDENGAIINENYGSDTHFNEFISLIENCVLEKESILINNNLQTHFTFTVNTHENDPGILDAKLV
tara:strand:+ start:184 stop:2193 length:2010 start_codon:yes stop_codon:yes gene_type:complete